MKNFMNYDFNINKIAVACFVRAGTGHAVHENRQSHGLAFHTGGEKVYSFSDGRTIAVNPNNVIYLPKHSTYNVASKVVGDCYAINFDIDEEVDFSPFALSINNHTSMLEYFRDACKVWYLKKPAFETKCKAELYNVIYTMKNEYFSDYAQKDKRHLIEPAVEYIHEHYTSNRICIDELSGLCGITPEYFRKIFNAVYGVSPVSYINSLRITRARELLETKMYSAREVCFLSGFGDESHFSRKFKKATGLPPSKYN